MIPATQFVNEFRVNQLEQEAKTESSKPKEENPERSLADGYPIEEWTPAMLYYIPPQHR